VDKIAAGQITFRAAAMVGLAGALLAWFGLKRREATSPPGPTPGRPARPLLSAFGSLREAARHVGREPRLAIVLAVAFVARGDSAIMSTFLSLWIVKASTAAGVSASGAMATAGVLLSAITFSGMAAACVIGWGADQFNRLAVLTGALALAGAGNLALITVRGFDQWPVYGLVGLIAAAETAIIVCGQALLGEQARAEARGATVGAFSVFGSMGVLVLLSLGGVLFDKVSGQAPFVMIGAVNLLASLAAACLLLTKPGAARPAVTASAFPPR
jgi:MFS family permease